MTHTGIDLCTEQKGCRTSPIRAVNRESPRPRQAVFWSRTPTLGVGEKANRGISEGSVPKRLTPSLAEAGEQGRNPQARQGRLHETQGVSLHFSTKLHEECCRKSGCRAAG